MNLWALLTLPGLDAGHSLAAVRRTGKQVVSLDLEQVAAGALSPERFFGAIHPYGDFCPVAAYEPIRCFHRGGGHLCCLGGVPFRRPVVPAGKGAWRVDLEAVVQDLPCWQQLLCEDLGGSSWCRLVEAWGLFLEVPANGRRVDRCEAVSNGLEDAARRLAVRRMAGALGPLEPGMRFRSLIDCRTDEGETLGAAVFIAEHRTGEFHGARLGGVCAPVPAGRPGHELLRGILQAFSGPMPGRAVRSPTAPRTPPRRRTGGLPDCRVERKVDGSVRLRVNGREVYPAIYEFDLTHGCLRRSIPAMYEAGVRIFKPCMNLFPIWTGDNKYSFAWFDDVVNKVLSASPRSFLWPNVSLTPGPWWLRRHPDESTVVDGPCSARDDAGNPGRPVLELALGPPAPSLGSRLWKRELGRAIEVLVEHIAASRYAAHFMGLQLGFGHASEWIENAIVGKRWSLGDRHPGMQDAFARFAARHPRWAKQRAHVPARPERFGSDVGAFKDPARGDLGTLWYEFMARQAAQTLDGAAKRVKQASRGRMLTSAFAGYFFQAGRCAYHYADAMSYAVSEYLRLRHVDAYETPYGYDERGINGNCTYRGLPDALAAHGKLYINQNDQRTHRATKPDELIYGTARTPRESIQVLKRNAGRALSRGAGQSWYDFGLGWFDDPGYRRTLAQLLKLGERFMGAPAQHLPGLGIVVDDHALFHQRMANTLLYRLMYEQCSRYFDRIGVPWYVYLLDDLLAGRIDPPHCCWLFLNTFLLDPAQRRVLRRRFCRGGNTLIWMYAPGFQSRHGLSTNGISELTGISVALLPVAASGQITVTDIDDPVTRGLAPHAVFGADDLDDKAGILDPVFYVQDPDAHVLGRLEAVNLPGFAVKRFPHWTSIYAATSRLDTGLYRSICRAAGVHVYADAGDVLYLHPRLVTLVAGTGGRKVLHMPRPCRALDALSGRILGSGPRIELRMSAGETRLIELRDM